MTDAKLRENLRALGIRADDRGLAALLPLVRVAWADGRIQDAERRLILTVAERHGLASTEQLRVIEGWLEEEPSKFFLATASTVLIELSRRASLPEGLGPERVVACCWALAAAAGGVLGSRFLSIGAGERQALEELATQLRVTDIPDWETLDI